MKPTSSNDFDPGSLPTLTVHCPSCGTWIDPQEEACPTCGVPVPAGAEMYYAPPHTAAAKIVSWILLAAIAATLLAVVVALLTT